MATVGQQLLLVVAGSLLTAVLGLVWVWRQSARPSLEAAQIKILRAQLADEMARNDKLAERSDRLAARVEALEEEQEIMREERRADREEAAVLLSELRELRQGIELLIAQLKKAELTPVWQPPEPKPRRNERPQAITLAMRIADGFDIEEMNNLAFDLGIHKSDFGGETRETRARELVSLVRRLGLEKSLAARVKELRP